MNSNLQILFYSDKFINNLLNIKNIFDEIFTKWLIILYNLMLKQQRDN